MAKWGEIKCPRCAEQDALWEGMERALEESDAREARLEAKLAKAVEALEQIAKPKVGPDFDWTDEEADRWRAVWYRKYQDIARATLAELKGQDE